ncbi:MAG: GFA family protein [Pseudomonadales bacterium]
MQMFNTQCACGAVQARFNTPLKTVVSCHCNMCRSLQGTSPMHWIAVNQSQFEVISGVQLLQTFDATARSRKHFCQCCGSTVYAENGKHFSDCVSIPLGSVLDADKTLAPQLSVYTEEAVDWAS